MPCYPQFVAQNVAASPSERNDGEGRPGHGHRRV